MKMIANTVGSLSNSMNVLSLYAEEGKLKLSYKTKGGKESAFIVGEMKSGKEVEGSLDLPLDSIRRVCALFPSAESVMLSVGQEGVVFVSEDVEILVPFLESSLSGGDLNSWLSLMGR